MTINYLKFNWDDNLNETQTQLIYNFVNEFINKNYEVENYNSDDEKELIINVDYLGVISTTNNETAIIHIDGRDSTSQTVLIYDLNKKDYKYIME